MALALSYARVFAALKSLSPPPTMSGRAWPTLDAGSDVVKELDVVARVLGRVSDRVELLLDELFPDTTTQLLSRFEKITRRSISLGDSLSARRDRVIAMLRRWGAYRLARLAQLLAPNFALSDTQVIFIESLREQIDEALTDSSVLLNLASPATSQLGRPWPGLIDDTGVRVYIDVSTIAASTVTLTHPDGTQWAIVLTATTAWYENRTAFLNKAAAGFWSLSYTAAGGVLKSWKLRVSNDVDAAQIYHFYAQRDPALSGTPDMVEGQRTFWRSAAAHLRAYACEKNRMTCDDAKSLVDREPILEVA